MRLWTVHPRYLDTKGLVAAWREGLLAQAVLQGKTKGYRNHPQLLRLKSSTNSVGAIAAYLRGIYLEAVEREFSFDKDKISNIEFSGRISCARGQLLFEWNHLRKKLKLRDPRRFSEIEYIDMPDAHSLFEIIEGDIEDWEIVRS